jgi:tetratricopeptide (TPR) repeat protein
MQLGTCYYRRGEYGSALDCHMRALSVYESARPRDKNAIATCLTAVANAHRARKELSEALDYAQRAWTLCESSGCENEIVVANSLTLLANIHHDRGDYAQTVKLDERAWDLLERTHIPDPFQTAELLNILGLAQMKLNELTEARHYFERALKIYSHKAPLGEAERIKVERNLQYVLEMQQNTDKLQHYS